MVWRYTEYSKCQQLTDWKDYKFKCEIILDSDVVDLRTKFIRTSSGVLGNLEIKTNDKLRPRFYMRIGENKSLIFNYELDILNGLKRILYKIENSEEYSILTPRFIDNGEFEDFVEIGKYAIERFPKISEEIVQSPKLFESDVPEDEVELVEKYFDELEKFPSWDLIQRSLSKEFSDIIKLYSQFEFYQKKLISRKNLFTQEQIQELSNLVEPLKYK